MMNPANLASKLAAALDQIVPKTFYVREEQGMVMIEGGEYRAASEVAETVDETGDPLRQAEIAASEALSMIQDYVAESLGTPWPATGTLLPLPKVEVTSDEIRMWYESADGERVLEAPVVLW